MLTGVRYGHDGSLQDDTGHSWRRVSKWVKPAEAERLVESGLRFLVQQCLSAPRRGRTERFRRNISPAMLTWEAAQTYEDQRSVPTVMVGELWRSDRDGDLLLFVEQGPIPRSDSELQDDW
jgi:hypothetical protein